jgi:ribosomal protein S27AE
MLVLGAPGVGRTSRSEFTPTHLGSRSRTDRARTFAVPYYDRAGESDVTRKKRKITYTCPSCDDKVWGKPEVRPHCGKCGLAPMIASYDTNRIATT